MQHYNFVPKLAGSDDPLALIAGFMSGHTGNPLLHKGDKKRDLAAEYIRGHKLGVSVKAGKEPMPAWVQRNKDE